MTAGKMVPFGDAVEACANVERPDDEKRIPHTQQKK